MGFMIVLVFVGVFALIAIPLAASAMSPSRDARQALATLDSVIRPETSEVHQQILDVRKNDKISSIPWLNQKLHRLEIIPFLRRMLAQAAIAWSPGRLLALTGACFAVPSYLVHLRFPEILPALGAGAAAATLPFAWVMYKRSKRLNKFVEVLPEALDLMVSALRAGHSLIAAMGLVARECSEPVCSEMKTCFEEQNYGLEMKTALDNLLERIPIQDLRMVATAIMIQKESGRSKHTPRRDA
jgi:tight adherence protein B